MLWLALGLGSVTMKSITGQQYGDGGFVKEGY